MDLTIIYIAAALAGVAWLIRRWENPKRRSRLVVLELQREYVRMLQMPEAAAEQQLDRMLMDMEDRHPGRTTAWLLRRMISDLKRDRN